MDCFENPKKAEYSLENCHAYLKFCIKRLYLQPASIPLLKGENRETHMLLENGSSPNLKAVIHFMVASNVLCDYSPSDLSTKVSKVVGGEMSSEQPFSKITL